MKYSRMSKEVYHPCVHLFTNYWLKDQVMAAANDIKAAVLGSKSAKTHLTGKSGTSQLAVQTEFTVTEYSGHSNPQDAFDLLDQRLDALFEADLAVHLLLQIQEVPPTSWQGIN